MIYLITMGTDGKSISVRTADEVPEELDEGVVVYDSGEEPVEIMRFKTEDGEVVPMTEADRAAEAAEMEVIAKAEANRRVRNILLQETDWTQLVDSALSDEDQAAYAAYRTALRDITEHDNWPMLEEGDWPTAP